MDSTKPTGRMSMDPPMQDITPHTELGEELKKLFNQEMPVKVMSFSELELRVTANLSEEELKEFLKGPP